MESSIDFLVLLFKGFLMIVIFILGFYSGYNCLKNKIGDDYHDK